MARHPIDLSQGRYLGGINAFGAVRVINGATQRPHSGDDWASNSGGSIPVYAMEAGTVVAVNNWSTSNSGPGRFVTLAQKSGHFMYGHLASVAVRAGQAVREGQQLGMMGNTGFSTGIHLHVTRFRSRATALANPQMPYRKAGESTAAWSVRAGVAEPIAIITAAPTPTPIDPLGGIMSYYDSKAAFRNDLRDIIRRHVPLSEMNSAYKDGKGRTVRTNIATEIRRNTVVGYQNRIKNDRAEVKIDKLTAEIAQLKSLLRKMTAASGGVAGAAVSLDTAEVAAVESASLARLAKEAEQDEAEVEAVLAETADAEPDPEPEEKVMDGDISGIPEGTEIAEGQ